MDKITPVSYTHLDVYKRQGKKLAVVPVLRAGLGMVNGITTLVPSAKIGHIGLYRDCLLYTSRCV